MSQAGTLSSTSGGGGDVVGPGSSTTGDIVIFADTTGKLLADSGIAFTTDGTLAANSDALIPTEKAIKTYVDTGLALDLKKANNLSDVANAATSRTNLGLAIGTNVQAYSAQLDSIAAIGNGIVAHTAANTFTARTLTGTANQITVTDGDGVAGNPTFSTPQNIDTAATPTFQSLILTGSGLTPLSLVSTDAGAGAGPIADFYRNSASPAASDLIGQQLYTGQNSTPAKVTYASITAQIDTATAGAEDSSWRIATMQAGALTNQLIALKTGCQIRGNNTNTSPPAGYIGEQITTGYQSAIALTTATPFNLGSISVTPGIWMFYAFIVYSTTSSVSGNTDWFCSFNTTSATLPGAGLQQVDIGTVTPRNGGNNISISHCFYTKVSATTTWYCVGQGSGSSVFNSVTGNGAFWAVRVG